MTPSSPLPHSTGIQARFLLVLLPFISYVHVLLLGARRGKKRPAATANASRLPPSPWRLPVIGQALAVVVSSAGAAREVMQAQDHVFASRPSLTIPKRLLYGCTDIAFAPHGPYWSGARKMSVRHLLSPARVRAYRAVREEEVEALARRVAEQASCRGGVVRLSELLNGFAKDVAGQIVLGLRAAGDDGWRAKVDALLEESNVLLGAFHVGDYIPWLSWVSAVDGTDARVRRAFQRIDGILDEIVDAAAASREKPSSSSPGPGDADAFIHVFLSLQQQDGAPAATGTGTAEWRLSRDNVKALLEDLFGAGTEATIIVLEWAMAELLRNKGVMEKLQREVRRQARSTGDGSSHGNMVGEHDLPGMEYLRAVIKETMRLHTPGPLLLPHKSMQATRIGGGRYDIPGGTMVIVNAWAIGRDPEAWESPEEFRPERFAGSAVDFRDRHFQLIPFGAGRRMCPGVNLAMSVVELALANLVAQFDWALPEGEAAQLDMEETTGCPSRKRTPLRAIATQHYYSGAISHTALNRHHLRVYRRRRPSL
ncbi:cytochrome P450 71A1-like [Panicum virgatum]|nr:cytochrome P450 71A1-like [Panicum virgatum]